MEINEFLETSKALVAKHTNDNSVSGTPEVKPEEVYVVWFAKTLQNAKALLGTNVSDGRYYESTLNGDKNVIYFDAYVKSHNEVVSVD